MRAAAIVLVLVGLVTLWALGAMGRLLHPRGRMLRAWRVLEAALRSRHELVPHLVLAIRAVAEPQAEALMAVIDARNAAMIAGGVRQRAAEEVRLSQALRAFLDSVSQSVPVQADAKVQQLEADLLGLEYALVGSAMRYNEAALALNRAHERVPMNVLAGTFRFEPATPFAPEHTDAPAGT